MYDLMNGIRVVEVAEHTFAPAAGMVLADWGADVIKVERIGGDAARNMKLPMVDGASFNPFFEAGNRGKRSVSLDLGQEAGSEILHKLIAKADVFITSLRKDARKKLGIEAEDLMARYPNLIYARATGFGLKGPISHRGGFDFPSSWCLGGAGYMQTVPGKAPPMQPGSVGDLTGGATLAGAVAAALFRRERGGKGAIVDNSLYGVGIWLMGQSILAAKVGLLPPVYHQEVPFDALTNCYQTRDGRWLSICLLQPGWWPDFVAHVERPELLDDPRFADPESRTRNKIALTEVLNSIFATRTYQEWLDKLDTMEGVWAPLQSPGEVADDPQALENGFVTEVTLADQTSYMASASPAQFDERPVGVLRAAPSLAEHTDDVLQEAGFSEAQINDLRIQGSIA